MKGYYDDYSWLKAMVCAFFIIGIFFGIQSMTGGIRIVFSNEPKIKALETQVDELEYELDTCEKNLLAHCPPVECKCSNCGLTAIIFFFVGGFVFIIISAWFKKFLSEYAKEVRKRASKEKPKMDKKKKTN